MSEAEKVYRTFPLCHDGTREVIDRAALKEQYMRSPKLSWADFCEEYGYHPKNRVMVPFRSWKEEKLQILVETGDEGLLDRQLTTRNLILRERANIPSEWNESTERSVTFMKAKEQEWAEALNWDQQHREQIKADPTLKKFNVTLSEMRALVGLKKDLLTLKKSALLLDGPDQYRGVIPIQNADPEVTQAESEGERLKAMGYQLIGSDAITVENLTQIYSKWIDQTKEIDSPDPEPENPANAPVTPLDDDDESE